MEAKGILEQTSMPIVSLQNLLKHQQRAEGIPFSPGKCLIVGGLTRGDTWRGFFGISAENWVNLYSEVLHLKIGRAPKSGKFRWSSICYSGAFRMLSWSIIKRVRGPSSAWCFFFRLKLQGKYLKLQKPRQQRWPRWLLPFWLISVGKKLQVLCT